MTRAWRGLVEILCHRTTRRAVQRVMDEGEHPLVERVAMVAPLLFGRSDDLTADDRASSAGIATLAVQAHAGLDVWIVRPGASRLIRETDLHAIPSEPPPILRRTGVVQAHRPETGDRLWGEIASLAWCCVDDAIYLLGVGYTEGPGQIDWAAAKWSPRWTGEEIQEQLPTLDLSSPLIRDHGAHQAFSAAAAQYLVTLGILATCDGSPLQIDLDRQTRWRHVRLGDASARRPDRRPGPIAQDARAPEIQQVAGHLRRQRYGAGCALTRWIYVQGYAARRWHARRWIVSERAC